MRMKRRSLFKGLAGVGAFASVAPAMRLFAAPPADFRFVSLYMSGGWDVLQGFDARRAGYETPGLNTGTALLPAAYQNPLTVDVAGKSVLWGASTRPLTLAGTGGAASHKDFCTLFRSVNMNTVAHAAGRAYVNTFRSPIGVVPRGSSFGTMMSTVGPMDDGLVLPNVSIGMPTFNDFYPPEFTGVRTALAPNITDLLRAPSGSRLDDATEALLAAAQDEAGTCVGRAYRGRRPADDLAESRGRVRRLLDENVGALFDLRADTPEGAELRGRYGLSVADAANVRHPSVVAAIAGQLLSTGLSRSVSATLQVGMDTHGTNWAATQSQKQEEAFTALAHLLWDLRRDDPNLERTVVMIHSEFARTPKINGTSGRDHWFSNSVAVFGGVLRPGVLGATVEENLGLQKTDLVSGDPSPAGEMLKPEMIAATVATAVGIDASAFRTAPLHDWIAS